MTAIAFIGLGAMGSRMAARLLDAGHSLTVWNRTAEKAQALVERGAVFAKSPADAAGEADVVITMLADPGALRDVTEGPDGVAEGLQSAGASATVIDMSTVGPEAVARLAEALPEGVGLLDAPVLGSIDEAAAGTLKVFVGGPAELAERWAPLLSVFGTPVHVGPLGSGAAAKLVANTTLFGVLGVLGEALAMAKGLGLSQDKAFEVLAGTPVAAQAQRRRPAVESGEYPVRFALDLALKDAALAMEAATAADVDVRVIPAAQSWLAEAAAAGQGGEDYSSVLGTILGEGVG
ncbi:NAD(P)-dependent oxidoreductase [Streptomyces sp. A7024]|uniref:NAD(P)-dependent oxidoreductase n=1 Tax=Streptomyces coryli TaxID=1128680 RepID=A0A6G4UF89_9ACTN|nr:NAD(P)-dependent oxidoreductase [Streptomyces coryli]NGN70471.1 NAD(P)-dependent oxidoreductase [Streptomyces coryli]